MHSTYSDGLATPLQLARQAAQFQHTHLALTDHSTLAGHPAFINACALYHLTPILGVEVRVHTPFGYGHNVVLTSSREDYQRLQWILSRREKISLGDLAGVGVVTSGCLGGIVAKALLREDYWKAHDILVAYRDLLGERFVVEAQPTFHRVLPWLLSLARTLSIPVLTTNDVHYLAPEDSYRHVNPRLHFATEPYLRQQHTFVGYQDGIDYSTILARSCAWIEEESDAA